MARPPDRLAFVIESMHEFPVLRIQPPYEPRRNAPPSVIQLKLFHVPSFGDGVDEAVATVFHSTPVFPSRSARRKGC